MATVEWSMNKRIGEQMNVVLNCYSNVIATDGYGVCCCVFLVIKCKMLATNALSK